MTSSMESTSASTWMGDHRERPGAVNLSPFVGVDCVAVIVLTRTQNESTNLYIIDEV